MDAGDVDRHLLVVRAPSGHATSSGAWLSTTIEARERAVEAAAPDAKASAVVRLARAIAWSGDVASAAQRLVSERRAQRKRGARAEVALCELGLAEIALLADDEDRAAVHLDLAREVPADAAGVRQLLAAWIGARRASPDAFAERPAADEPPWAMEIEDAVALELSWSNEDATGIEVRGTDVRTRSLLQILQATRSSDVSTLETALSTLESSGLGHDFGRSVLRVLAANASLLAKLGADPSQWVERARQALDKWSTWRDRVALRHAQRLHGADVMLPRDVASRLDARDRMQAHVRSTVATGLDRQSRALDDLETALSSGTTDRATVQAIGALRDAIDLLDAATSASLSELAREDADLAPVVTSNFADAARGRELAKLVEAMPEGVVALDSRGVIVAVNDQAARAMHVEAHAAIGRHLADVEALAPLASALAPAERPEGVVVRGAHGSFVVSAKDAGDSVIATITEFDRAFRIAHKLVATRAHYTFADLRGSDPALHEAIEVARRAALVDASVLIVGEVGTGKELLANAIHSASPRAREPFVAIDCANLANADPFAREDGTLFLNQVVELPTELQNKLLDRLQERAVRGRSTRARIIATARHDPSLEVEKGTFLPELLKLLKTLAISLPPLRERPGDILLLAQHFARRIGERQGKSVRTISKEVESALLAHTWPGNVRELADAIDKEVSSLAPDQRALERVPASIVRTGPGSPSLPPAAASIVPLAEVERLAYLDAYEKCNRSVTKAARALGVSKVTFYGKLRLFGMHPAETTGDLPAMKSAAKILAQEAIDQAREEAQPSKKNPKDR